MWPPIDPPGVDDLAAQFPLDCRYQRVRTIEECKAVIAHIQVPVLVSLSITGSWHNASGGRIPRLSPSDVPVGFHCISLVGYDDSKATFKFQNSWGANWGDRGFGYVSYDVLKDSWVEGWLQDYAARPIAAAPESGVVERLWGVREHGGGIFHCREFVGHAEGKIAWVFCVERAGEIEIEELFVMPQFRGKGRGAKLVRLVEELAVSRGASLRAWVSHIDSAPGNLAVVKKLFAKVGLRLVPADTRWASHVALPQLNALRA